VPKAASHRCKCVVVRRCDGEGRLYTVHLKSNPGSTFDVPQQHIEGRSDDFLAAKISHVHPPSKPTEQTSYDLVFQQARPSLRRLRRHQRRKQREDAEKVDVDAGEAESESPPRVRRSREWGALDLSLLKLPQELQALAFPPEDEAAADAKSAKSSKAKAAAADKKGGGKKANKKDKKDKKDKKANKKANKKDRNVTTSAPKKGKKNKKSNKKGKKKDASSPKNADPEPTEVVSNPITSVLLPPQRALIRARDKTFQAYCEQFRQSAHEVHERFAAVVEREKVWAENWSKMVELLKQSSDF